MSVFTPEEINYLQNQRLARIATVGPDGQPHVVPVGFRYNPDTDTIDIGGHDFAQRKKWRDVQQNPRAAVGAGVLYLVQSGASPQCLGTAHASHRASWPGAGSAGAAAGCAASGVRRPSGAVCEGTASLWDFADGGVDQPTTTAVGVRSSRKMNLAPYDCDRLPNGRSFDTRSAFFLIPSSVRPIL
jgi:hypothetical protein